MRVLVDADIYAYSCGFAGQKTVYFTEEPELVVEPVENVLQMCRASLEGIYNEVSGWLEKSGESVSHLELFLTGTDNFREKIATIRGYKANRIGKPKPVHYNALREYMVNVWKATVVDGYEADDAVTIEAHKHGHDPDEVMIASVDKDLKTVPGLLYSFKKREAQILTEDEARGNFYRQMLTGDTIDNVLGCWKCGPKRAATVVQDCMPAFKQWKTVLGEFQSSVNKAGCPYTDPEAAAIETGRLLHMLRTPNDVWSPPQ